jgi:hypothetical protein
MDTLPLVPMIPIISESRPDRVVSDLERLFQDAVRAYRRGDGNAGLHTSGNTPNNIGADGVPFTISYEPDRLVFIVEGKKASKEAYEALTDLMRLWDGE